MTSTPFLRAAYATPQEALVATAATPLAIFGYPLLESVRTCRLQASVSTDSGYGRAPIGQFGRSQQRWTHRDRDIVTPANDLLYFSAWLDLCDAAATLVVPPSDGRYFVVEMLDAYTNNFLNLGLRNVGRTGGRFRLRGPSTPVVDADAEAGMGDWVECPTDLVWLLGRVLVVDDADLPAARRLMSGFELSGAPMPLPASARAWQDTGDAAIDFFGNLSRAVAEFPPPAHHAGLWTLLRSAGIRFGEPDALERATPRVLDGLRAAHAQAMQIIDAHTRSQSRRAWGFSTRLGRWGDDLLLRATTAMKGLGALSSDEAIYAMADFDAMGEPLDGSRRYQLRFAAGGLPPADAFWSVSLYGPDRYFVDHSTPRYAVGDRTPGLQFDADGALVIPIQHVAPEAWQANWLPAPAGPFYLILRVYHPRPELLDGRYVLPAVESVA